MMFVKDQLIDGQKELNTCEFESQDATTITSASSDSRINFSWMIVSLWSENIMLVLGSYDHFSQCFTFFLQLCDHVIIKIDWCWQSEQVDTEFCSAP